MGHAARLVLPFTGTHAHPAAGDVHSVRLRRSPGTRVERMTLSDDDAGEHGDWVAEVDLGEVEHVEQLRTTLDAELHQLFRTMRLHRRAWGWLHLEGWQTDVVGLPFVAVAEGDSAHEFADVHRQVKKGITVRRMDVQDGSYRIAMPAYAPWSPEPFMVAVWQRFLAHIDHEQMA